MKQALLVVSTGCEGGVNIGDYIQALAAKQFLSEANIYLERETDLAKYVGDPVSIIMNGWYMNHTENWPPSDKILPLFVSMHINRCGLPGLISKESIAYLKAHQPIGCRDTNTVEILMKQGVEAYFSGCLTLTLGLTYKPTQKTGKTYIVEPVTCRAGLFAHHKRLSAITVFFLIKHFFGVKRVTAKIGNVSLRNLFYTAYFLSQYKKRFDYKMLVNATYINQYNPNIQTSFPTHEQKLAYADQLLREYVNASCVITSRIHCALPCLGMGTPVIFIDDVKANSYSTDRLGGLKNLLNVMEWDGLHLRNTLVHELIDISNFPSNKSEYQSLSKKLIETCQNFVNQTKAAEIDNII